MGQRFRVIVLVGLAGATALAQSGTAQPPAEWRRSNDTASSRQSSPPRQSGSKAESQAKPDSAGMDEAVRWERAKDRAAKRQAEIEAQSKKK